MCKRRILPHSCRPLFLNFSNDANKNRMVNDGANVIETNDSMVPIANGNRSVGDSSTSQNVIVAAVDKENESSQLTKNTVDKPVPNIDIPGTSKNDSSAANVSDDTVETDDNGNEPNLSTKKSIDAPLSNAQTNFLAHLGLRASSNGVASDKEPEAVVGAVATKSVAMDAVQLISSTNDSNGTSDEQMCCQTVALNSSQSVSSQNASNRFNDDHNYSMMSIDVGDVNRSVGDLSTSQNMLHAAVDEEKEPNQSTKNMIDKPAPNAQTILVSPGTSTNASSAADGFDNAAETVIVAIATQSSDAIDAIQAVSSPNSNDGASGDLTASTLDSFDEEDEVESSTNTDEIVPACAPNSHQTGDIQHISDGQKKVPTVPIGNVNRNVVGPASSTTPDVSIASTTVPTSGATSAARNFNVRVAIERVHSKCYNTLAQEMHVNHLTKTMFLFAAAHHEKQKKLNYLTIRLFVAVYVARISS